MVCLSLGCSTGSVLSNCVLYFICPLRFFSIFTGFVVSILVNATSVVVFTAAGSTSMDGSRILNGGSLDLVIMFV